MSEEESLPGLEESSGGIGFVSNIGSAHQLPTAGPACFLE